MTIFETILAFLTVAILLSIPITAIITRKSSIIGQAIADRIRNRGKLRDRAAARFLPGDSDTNPPQAGSSDLAAIVARQESMIETQQEELSEIRTKLDFVQRLLESSEDTHES